MKQPIRILYIDDYPHDRELVRDALEKEHGGFELVEATSRANFESNLARGDYDLVLSDFNILGFEGLQVLEAVKSKDPELPVIIVTGTGSEEVAAEAIKRGASDYVIKTPRHIQLLPHLIHDVLDKRRLEAEKKRVEEAYSQTRDLLTNLARLVPGVIYQYRLYPDGHSAFPYSSPGMNEIYEYAPEDVREDASPVFGRLHPEDYDMVSKAIFESARTLEEFYCEFRVILPRQGLRWRWSQAHPERMPDGGTLWHGIISDITERKLIEEKLEQERILLRTLIDNLPDRVYVMDSQGRKTLANIADLRSTGLKKMEDIIGKTDLEVYPIDLAKIYWDRNRTVIDSGKPLINFEEPGLDEQGNPAWLLTSKLPLRDTHENVIGLVGIGRDITERKQAEILLRESEEKFKYVFDHSPVGKSITKITGEISVNQSFCEMLGYSPEELTNINWRKITHPEDIEFSQKVVDVLLSGEKETARFTKRYLKKDGSILWADVNTSMRRDAAGKPMYLMTAVVDITERKQAEEALLLSETRFRTLFEHAPVGVALIDTKTGRYLDINPKYCEFLGYTREEAKTLSFQDVSHPGELKANLEGNKSMLEGRIRNFSLEKRFVCKDGTIKWGSLTASPLWGKDETPTQYIHIAVVQDITDRRLAEETLRESEERFRSLFTNMINGFAYCKMLFDGNVPQDFIYLDVNQAFETLTGLKNVIGKKVSEVIPGIRQSDPELLQTYGRVALTGKPETHEIYVKAMKMWFSIAVYSPKKEYFVAVFDVITERKKLEAQLQNFYDILNAGLNELFTFDANTLRFEFVSAGALKNLQYTLAQMVEKTPLDIKPEYTPAAFEKLVAPLRRHEEPLIIFNTVHQRSDGSTYPVEVHLQLFDQIEHPIFLAVVLDITKHKQAEDEIRQLNATLEKRVEERTRELRETQEKLVRQERLAVLGQLAGGVAHELRNPLGVISNSIYYLNLIQPDANEKVKNYHSMIEQEVRTAEKIISGLLGFSRNVAADLEPVSIPEIVRGLLQRYPVPAPIRLELIFPPTLPLITADPHHVETVLGNLIVNAYQAMMVSKTGSSTDIPAEGTLTVSARRNNETVEISVKDTGVGISPENMKRLFEPLFTTKLKGIGLGLAVSKRLVEANNGRIEVESKVGKGSTFTLIFPVHSD